MQHQLAQGTDDEEGEETADRVGDGQRGSGGVQSATGAQEEAGTDRSTDGDHVHMPALEALAIARVARILLRAAPPVR